MLLRLTGFGLLFLLLGGRITAGDNAAFTEYTPKAGGFTVVMPGTPKEMQQTVKPPTGPPLAVNTIQVEAAAMTYVVVFTDYPEAAIKRSDPEKTLENTRDSAVTGFQGKLVSDKKITLDKHPGREVVIELAGTVQYRSRLYLVKNRMYQLAVAGPKDKVASADADKFLDSLKLPSK